MPKYPRKASTVLSILFALLFLLVLLGGAFFLPYLTRQILPESRRVPFTAWNGRLFVMILGYAGLAIGAAADGVLLLLLHSVRRGRVFTPYCVALLRSLSWCCMGEAAIFLALSVMFLLAIGIAFTALLTGLCLRVVKSVFEAAIAIKEENDLTV